MFMKLNNILLTLFSLVLVVVIIEASLHAFNYPKSPEIGWRLKHSPYISEAARIENYSNQFGLRGQKIAYNSEDFVVVLLGDSQVEAGLHPAKRLPEKLLEAALKQKLHSEKVKVFSVAAAGWGQDQQLLALKAYFKDYRADLVLNWTTPVNDYWENTFIDRSITPEAGKLKPTFSLNAEQLTPIVPFVFEWKLRNLFALAIAHGKGNKKYTIEQYYTDRWQTALPSPVSITTTKDQCPSVEILEKDLIESFVAGSRNYTLITTEDVEHGRSHFSPFLKNSSARDLYAISLTHRLFQELVQLSAENGAQFRIFHPYRSDLDGAFREIKCVKTQVTGRYYEFDGSDWLRYLKQSNLNKQLLTVDIVNTKSMTIGKSDWHLGYEGNQQLMTILADTLVKMDLYTTHTGPSLN